MRMVRFTPVALLLVLAVTFVASAVWLYCSHAGGSLVPAKFDASIWHASVESRRPMLVDLATNHLQPGLPEKKVIELLGPPNRRLTGAEVHRAGEDEAVFLFYDLPFDHVEYECANWVVVLDKEGRVLRTVLQEK